MLQKRTQFITLPNEIIYHIFDFLTTVDILRAFTQLNRRYDDLIRFHIKRIDLTDDWEGDHYQLQWICGSIQTLKIDQHHLHYLSNYQFGQLHSLSLINVSDWQNVTSNMNLKNLYLWFDEGANYYREKKVIPTTVLRFSRNTILEADAFHTNLIHLSLCALSVVHLVKIVECTPSVQHLSVTIRPYYHTHHDSEDEEPLHFETLTSSFCGLTALRYLSISVTYARNVSNSHYDFSDSNERLLFDQIQIFIDRCCTSKATLTHVTLRLYEIQFLDDLWPAFLQYKKTFDRFDFYISLILSDKPPNSIEIPSAINPIGSHVEGIDPLRPQGCFLHVYSLPFVFDSLYGFTSCSELNSQSSFSSVRHLYFTKIPLSRPVSFQSLVKYMPRLVSINCDLIFNDPNISDSEITFDADIFYYVHSLRFSVRCSNKCVDYLSLLPRLFDHMPHLRKLIYSGTVLLHTFSHRQRPLTSLKLLDLRNSHISSFDILPQRVPFLSTLLLNTMMPGATIISQIIGTLFLAIPLLSFVSYRIIRRCDLDRTYREIAERALILMKNMDNCLFHLSLYFESEGAVFSRRN